MSEGFKFAIPMEAGGFIGRLRGLAAVQAIAARAAELVQNTLEQYKTDGAKLPSKDVFLAAASTLYDQLCQMTDVPYLPDGLEKQLEAIVKPAFLRGVELAYDAFAA